MKPFILLPSGTIVASSEILCVKRTEDTGQWKLFFRLDKIPIVLTDEDVLFLQREVRAS